MPGRQAGRLAGSRLPRTTQQPPTLSRPQPGFVQPRVAHPPVTFLTLVKPCCSSHWLICMLHRQRSTGGQGRAQLKRWRALPTPAASGGTLSAIPQLHPAFACVWCKRLREPANPAAASRRRSTTAGAHLRTPWWHNTIVSFFLSSSEWIWSLQDSNLHGRQTRYQGGAG